MIRLIPWSSHIKGTLPHFVYISHNLNHVSDYHVISSCLPLGFRLKSSFSLLLFSTICMAYQHKYRILRRTRHLVQIPGFGNKSKNSQNFGRTRKSGFDNEMETFRIVLANQNTCFAVHRLR